VATAAAVSTGSVLVCHPVACLGQPTLHASVMLMVREFGANGEKHQIGVVVNKPLRMGHDPDRESAIVLEEVINEDGRKMLPLLGSVTLWHGT